MDMPGGISSAGESIYFSKIVGAKVEYFKILPPSFNYIKYS